MGRGSEKFITPMTRSLHFSAVSLPPGGGGRALERSSSIEIGGRLAPPPLSHHPACLLGTGRFLAASILQSKIDGFGGNQAVCSPLARPDGCADSATLSARRRSFGRCPRCLCWRAPSPGLPRGWPPRPPSPLTLAPRRVSLLPPTTLAPPPDRQFRLRPRCPYRGKPPPCPPSRVGVARVGGCLSGAPCR